MNDLLDSTDRKILFELDTAARRPNVAIAKKVGVSKDVVNYRIKKLEQAGYIQGYYTIIDLWRLGFLNVRVYLTWLDVTPETEQTIVTYLANHHKVFFLAQTDGQVNLAFGVWVKSMNEFEEFYNSFKKRFKRAFGSEQLAIFTQAHHFHRAYLIDKSVDDARPEYMGRSPVIDHDETDLAILKLLARNARMPVVEIARALSMPVATAAFRIKQLEKKGIIQGYRFIFDFKKIGYEYYKVDVMLRDMAPLPKMIAFARSHPNILYVDETIGGSDFEFDCEVPNKEAFLELMTQLRTAFPEIRSWTFFTLRKYVKLLYFPGVA